jgi:DNA (cytosine-5)-methyltransferase 1
MTAFTFYEFFAGGGMARAGLGRSWSCLFANDFDKKKAAAYAANWGDKDLCVEDVALLATRDIPGSASVAWASFPCQDLSLAGAGAGLSGERSGTFWPFWRLVKSLGEEGRAPTAIALENVCGALTSHAGRDFGAIGAALADGGYTFGALVVDAVNFVPQSRPRLFIVAVRQEQAIPASLTSDAPTAQWHPPAVLTAFERLPPRAKKRWIWWRLPLPEPRVIAFADLIEEQPHGVAWHTAAETRRLLDLMTPINRKKVELAKKAGRRMIGGVYKRTRQGVQRAEVRFDDVAGCLRTPAGGSSRQAIMVVEGVNVRSRLLSPREAARLMGLPDSYQLPHKYNDAYHLAGDGVCVPVVRHLAQHILEPLLADEARQKRKAA